MPGDVIAIAAVLSFAALIFLVLPEWLRHRTRCLEQSGLDIDIAFHASQRLLKDEAVPAGLTPLIVYFFEQAGQPGFAGRIAVHMLRGTLGTPSKPENPIAIRVSRDLDGLSPERKADVAVLVAASALSSASSHPLFAGPLRNMVMFSFGLTTGGSREVLNTSAVRVVAQDVLPRVRNRDCDLVAA